MTAGRMSVNKNVFPVHASPSGTNRFVARGNKQLTPSHICGANFSYALPMSAKRAAESRGSTERYQAQDAHFRQFFNDVIDAALDSGELELDAVWRPMLHDDGGDGTVIVH